MNEQDEILTPDQIADRLKLDTDTVKRFMRIGKLPGFKVGGRWRTENSKLEEWIKENYVEHRTD